MFASNTSQVSSDAVYVEDVFSTYLYTGTGATQTITNGIDFATYGGLLWSKSRSEANGGHFLSDTARGINNVLSSQATFANSLATYYGSFSTSGYSLSSNVVLNGTGGTWGPNYVSWSFRKQPKFFDVVTYTGNGANRTIAHNLGSVPGCIIVKRTDTTADWQVYHRSLANTEYMVLNTTAAKATGTTRWNSTTPTSTVFSLGTDATVNASGGTYVAYLFAHDAGGFGTAGTDNVISCGSYTGNGSGNQSVNLGWEPQWILVKSVTAGASYTDWWLFDNMRGWPVGASTQKPYLRANASGAESTTSGMVAPSATGFDIVGSSDLGQSGITYIYIAIRRGPMKTPTSGTSVFQGITRTGNAAVTTVSASITPDATWIMARTPNTWKAAKVFDRLRGAPFVYSNLTDAEVTNATAYVKFDVQNGYTLGQDSGQYDINISGTSYINWNFKRAPGFFDEVCYTGNATARTISHNLGVAPELMIVKRRDSTSPWSIYAAPVGAGKVTFFDTAAPINGVNYWNNTAPTSSVFSLGIASDTNTSGGTFIAYLFASCPGVSKIGTYTGNGSSQTINCGFTGGARFVLIKRTSATGDWYVWDTARGIVSANDPYLTLTSTASEVTTDDSIDPDSSGFIVNQNTTTNINVNAATYIYLAIA